jgi:HAD superfamily hydrolase (TIGR01549 family)
MKVLFLDAGGVITRLRSPKPAVFAEACSQRGMKIPLSTCEMAFRAADRLLEERLDEFLSEYPRFRSRYLDVLRIRTGLDDSLESVFDDYMRLLQSARFRTLYEDVIPTLEALRSTSIRLGVLSNASRDLVPLLFRFGVAHYFDAIIVSELVGSEKPQREIFMKALETLDVEPQEAVHVGDSYHHDYLGATRAGLQAVLLDRKGTSSWGVPTLRSLQELPDALNRLF